MQLHLPSLNDLTNGVDFMQGCWYRSHRSRGDPSVPPSFFQSHYTSYTPCSALHKQIQVHRLLLGLHTRPPCKRPPHPLWWISSLRPSINHFITSGWKGALSFQNSSSQPKEARHPAKVSESPFSNLTSCWSLREGRCLLSQISAVRE